MMRAITIPSRTPITITPSIQTIDILNSALLKIRISFISLKSNIPNAESIIIAANITEGISENCFGKKITTASIDNAAVIIENFVFAPESILTVVRLLIPDDGNPLKRPLRKSESPIAKSSLSGSIAFLFFERDLLISIVLTYEIKTIANPSFKIIGKKSLNNPISGRTGIGKELLISGENLIPSLTFPGADINMDGAWEIEKGKEYIRVGVLDHMIFWANEDFGDGTFTGSKIVDGYDYYNNLNVEEVDNPDNSHGTAAAGIIGAIRNNDIGIAGIAGGNFNVDASTGVSLYSIGVFGMIGLLEQFIPVSVAADAIFEASHFNPGSEVGFGYELGWT